MWHLKLTVLFTPQRCDQESLCKTRSIHRCVVHHLHQVLSHLWIRRRHVAGGHVFTHQVKGGEETDDLIIHLAVFDACLALVAETYRISADRYLARNILLLLTALGLCGCSDVVTKEYPTYADAAADRLFERGWLPSIIPPSSYEIRVESNLDRNDAEGQFCFAPKERLRFLSALRKMQVSEIQEADMFPYLERGYWPYEFRSQGYAWIFYVNEQRGLCNYRMSAETGNF